MALGGKENNKRTGLRARNKCMGKAEPHYSARRTKNWAAAFPPRGHKVWLTSASSSQAAMQAELSHSWRDKRASPIIMSGPPMSSLGEIDNRWPPKIVDDNFPQHQLLACIHNTLNASQTHIDPETNLTNKRGIKVVMRNASPHRTPLRSSSSSSSTAAAAATLPLPPFTIPCSGTTRPQTLFPQHADPPR